MKNRFLHLDLLKGFAIFLMVMGHIVPCQFEDWSIVLSSPGAEKKMFCWYVIYSFHMPLFFFVSGYLSMTDIGDKSVLFEKLWHRTLSLMFPYIFGGALLYLVLGGGDYWFLRALYAVIVVALIYEYTRQKFNLSIYFDFIFLLSCFLLLNYFNYRGIYLSSILEIRRIDLFIAFYLGYYVRRYPHYVEKFFMNNYVYSVCLVLWACSFTHIDLVTRDYWYINTVSSLSAIVCLYNLSKTICWRGKMLNSCQ